MRSRDDTNWVSRIWTLTLVTLVSAFIWALAESQTVQTVDLEQELVIASGSEDTQIIRLQPGTDAESRAVAGPTRLRAELRIQGSPGALDALRERLRGGVTLTAGDEFPTGPGELFAVNLAEALEQHAAFRDAAVTIVDTGPEIFRVEIAELTTRPARVALHTGDGLLEGPPQITPGELMISLPASLAAELGEAPLQVLVRLDAEALEDLQPGVPATLQGLRAELPPELAGRWGVRLDTRPISAVITLRSRTAALDLAQPLPVQVVLAPSELDRFSVEIAPGDQDVQNIRLVGPIEQIDRVRRALADPASPERPFAALILDFEELERGITSKPVELLRLPRGVTAEIEDRIIRFRVQRRGAPEAPAGAGSPAATPPAAGE